MTIVETVGDGLELIGTLITAYGLWFAWNRNSNRRVRAWIATRYRHVAAILTRHRPTVRIEIPTAEAVATAGGVTVHVGRSELDSSLPLEEQLRRVLDQVDGLSRDLQKHRERIEALEDGRTQIGPRIEQAIESAQSAEQTRARTAALADLTPALIGVAFTAIGIFVGILG